MRKRIGDIFVEKGLISNDQLAQALDVAKTSGIRLGDAAVQLGFIKPKTLQKMFGNSNKEDFFYLDVNFFPAITQDLFDAPTMLRHGVLPLGFKTEMRFFRTKKLLNLGLLTPDSAEERLPELKALAQSKLGADSFQDVKIYVVLADQFLDVLARKYSFPESKIREGDFELDESLIVHFDLGGRLVASRP
jgi:hypothetical protein